MRSHPHRLLPIQHLGGGLVTEPRMRHCNRQATRERLTLTMQKRAPSGEQLVWSERAVPVIRP